MKILLLWSTDRCTANKTGSPLYLKLRNKCLILDIWISWSWTCIHHLLFSNVGYKAIKFTVKNEDVELTCIMMPRKAQQRNIWQGTPMATWWDTILKDENYSHIHQFLVCLVVNEIPQISRFIRHGRENPIQPSKLPTWHLVRSFFTSKNVQILGSAQETLQVGKIQKNEFLKQNEEIPVYTSWNKPDMANTSTTVTSCWCPTIRQKSTFVSIKETEKKIRERSSRICQLAWYI
jgi:DNA segregation ATPase FtsK/SpoIIIE-like protein